MCMHAAAGRDVSISDLLADVRRIKLAGDSLRAGRSRPSTAASQGRAAANSPGNMATSSNSKHEHGVGPTHRPALDGCLQKAGSCTDYSSDESSDTGVQSAAVTPDSASPEQLSRAFGRCAVMNHAA